MNEPLIGRRAGILLGLLLGAVALAVPVSVSSSRCPLVRREVRSAGGTQFRRPVSG